MFIDTHTHIYLDAFRSDIAAVMERASAAGVTDCYLPAIDRSVMGDLLALEAAYPIVCHAMAGLHPCSVKDDFEEELMAVRECLDRRSFSAVGEIGLDFHWDLSHREQQYEAFHRQVDWAVEKGLPVVLHSRKATDECIQVIREHQDGRLRGVFHCFSGTLEQAEAVVGLGFLLGIGGVLTYKNGGLEPVIRALGIGHVVLETDAPYLSPVPHRGKRNEPAHIVHVAEALSRITGLTIEEVAAVTTANARSLFSC
jgi:TatD DNase family protein